MIVCTSLLVSKVGYNLFVVDLHVPFIILLQQLVRNNSLLDVLVKKYEFFMLDVVML